MWLKKYIQKPNRNTEKIKIISCVLKGIEGMIIENKEGRFIDVLLESIGQSVRVKLPEEILIQV